jgi:hypothetical protein
MYSCAGSPGDGLHPHNTITDGHHGLGLLLLLLLPPLLLLLLT